MPRLPRLLRFRPVSWPQPPPPELRLSPSPRQMTNVAGAHDGQLVALHLAVAACRLSLAAARRCAGCRWPGQLPSAWLAPLHVACSCRSCRNLMCRRSELSCFLAAARAETPPACATAKSCCRCSSSARVLGEGHLSPGRLRSTRMVASATPTEALLAAQPLVVPGTEQLRC